MAQRKNEKRVRRNSSRREVLKHIGALGAAAVVPTFFIVRNARSATRLVLRDAGGPVQEAYSRALYKPFQAETGIEIVAVASAHEPVSQVKAMVETKTYTWDMAVLPNASERAARSYLAELRISDDPQVRKIPNSFQTPYLMGLSMYATVFPFRTDKYKERKPADWRDFWDLKNFPGRRALRKSPIDTIEQALLADGVSPEKVYPCDFDRAFRKLNQIKKSVNVWWSGGAQASQLLKSGEVDMCPTWNSRAQPVIDAGAPVEICWKNGFYQYEGIAILKGGPNEDACRRFAAFCANPERQAAITATLPIGPASPDAYKYVDPARAKILPSYPPTLAQMFPIDVEFWARERERAIDLFDKWILS